MSKSRSLRCAALYVLALFTAAVLAAQELSRQGAEFQVNSYTTSDQSFPSVAAFTDGAFLVVWDSSFQDGSGGGVFAQRHAAGGARVGLEFRVNSYTMNTQSFPSVAVNPSGGFVVAWQGYYSSLAAMDIFARRFDQTGVALSVEFRVNSHTVEDQYRPQVAMDDEGGFVVAWESAEQDGSDFGVFAQRFDAAGTPLAAEFRVNTHVQDGQRFPVAAMGADGGFVVAWQSFQDGDSGAVMAQRFSASGDPAGSEFLVNSHTTDNQSLPAVAMSASGDFVVVWESFGQDGSYEGVFARAFDAAGAPLASEFQVSELTIYSQVDPAVSAVADGGFLVAWTGYAGANNRIFARRVLSTGAALAQEFQVDTDTSNAHERAAVPARSGSSFVVAWESNGQDGSQDGIFAQRLRKPAILDIDANGTVGPLTDGLLVLRFLFGFTDASLTSGAVGNACTRCDATAIAGYLETLI